MALENLRKEYLDKLDIHNHSKNHVDSFNYFINEGINMLADGENWFDIYRDSLNEERVKIRVKDFHLGNTNQTPF